MKKRLDVILFEKGLARSREKAKALIMAGNVMVDNEVITKSGLKIDEKRQIYLKETINYVGRGAYKLIKALDDFNVNPNGYVCVDVGSSTGGFTNVLLERGADFVYCVDVGTNQLAYKLRINEKVEVMEQTNAKHITREMFDKSVDLAVIDVSFISLISVLEPLLKILSKKNIIALVKPQFEVGREISGFKGVVKDNEYRLKALEKVVDYAQTLGLYCTSATYSPVTGPKGNLEFFLYLTGTRNTVYLKKIVEQASAELE